MELLQDTSVWYVFSFLIFLVVAVKMGKDIVIGLLDGRIEEIRKNIEDAENLRVEAQELLAQYQRKHKDAVKDADAIIARAQTQADEIRAKAEEELNETIERREKQLQERLERIKKSATDEIRSYAAELALNATSQIVTEKLDKKANEKLVDAAIKDIGSRIH